MKKINLLSLLIFTVLFGVQIYGQYQNSLSTTFNSYQKARKVLEKSIKAHGGLDKIKKIENASLEYEGLRTMINQSRKPENMWDKEPSTGELVFDQKNNRMYAISFSSYPGIGKFGAAWAIKGTEGFHWEPQKNHHGSEIISKLTGAETDGPWAFIPRWIPPFLLLSAWENNTNLRWVGEFEKNGRKFEAISFIQRDRVNLVVIIDSETFLLEGFETIRDDGVYGDVTEFVRFSEFKEFAGVKFPTKRTDYFNDQLARELNLKFSVNSALDEKIFEMPEGFSTPTTTENTPRIKKIAEGIYLDTEIGGVMIVEFKEFLVVVECPGDFWMSQSTIDAIKQLIPNKPIKYVVPSHTHGDHGGGARAYFYNGATLLTTQGNVEFYKKLANIKQTIRPDPLSINPKKPIIEIVDNKRIISDETQTLELYDFGKNDHTDELIFAYLPKQKIVWQSDIVFSPWKGSGINRAMPISIEFAKRLKEMKIDDFKQMVESHHDRTISREEFRESLQMAGYNNF